jgi:hypothetical protein
LKFEDIMKGFKEIVDLTLEEKVEEDNKDLF